LPRGHPKGRVQLEEVGQLIVQISLPACDHVNDNKSDAAAEVGGALRREQATLGRTIFVAGADEFDRGCKPSTPFGG
jgi:hypothetical protein